jgi:hypothetical protein
VRGPNKPQVDLPVPDTPATPGDAVPTLDAKLPKRFMGSKRLTSRKKKRRR